MKSIPLEQSDATTRTLDDLHALIRDPNKTHEAILQPVQQCLLTSAVINSFVLTDSQGLSTFDMVCMIPGRVSCLPESLVLDFTQREAINKLLFVYHAGNVPVLLKQCDKTSLTRQLQRIFKKNVHVGLNMIGAERLCHILQFLFKNENDHFDVSAVVDMIESGPAGERSPPDQWQKILCGCDLAIIKVFAQILPNQQWLSSAAVKDLVTYRQYASMPRDALPDFVEYPSVSTAFWQTYYKLYYVESVWVDTVTSRCQKVAFLKPVLNEKLVEQYFTGDLKDNAFTQALLHHRYAIMRAIVLNFGVENVVHDDHVQKACDENDLRALALFYYTKSGLELARIMSNQLGLHEPQKIEEILQHLISSRIKTLSERLVHSSSRTAAVSQALIDSLCSMRSYLPFHKSDYERDYQRVSDFSQAIQPFEKDMSLGEIEKTVDQICHSEECTIFHLSGLYTHLYSLFRHYQKWRVISDKIKGYAVKGLNQELDAIIMQGKELKGHLSDHAKYVVFMRQRKLLSWLCQQPLYLSDKGSDVLIKVGFGRAFEKRVRECCQALGNVQAGDGLSLMVAIFHEQQKAPQIF